MSERFISFLNHENDGDAVMESNKNELKLLLTSRSAGRKKLKSAIAQINEIKNLMQLKR